jgi:signal transduction histidine kinase
MEIINDFNLKKQADDLGVKVWQTPGFLFVMMGVITATIMTATFFIYKNSDDPQVLIISECLIACTILIIGTAIIRFVNQIIRLNKMKSDFVSIASHQLRTPLSAIKWETELMLTKFKKGLDKKQLEKVKNISVLNQRMVKLVNDLLDVARIDQNRLILRKNGFDLQKISTEVLSVVLPSVKMRHIEIITNVQKNIPSVFGDQEKIKMVVENLLNNAIKYTTSGGKIEIKLFKKDSEVVFEIKDNGVGIPEEQHSRVFDKFFRSDNAVKYQTEGTGLGLYISKNIIEQLGGKIWFQSIENVGSMFSFSLPIARRGRFLHANTF